MFFFNNCCCKRQQTNCCRPVENHCREERHDCCCRQQPTNNCCRCKREERPVVKPHCHCCCRWNGMDDDND